LSESPEIGSIADWRPWIERTIHAKAVRELSQALQVTIVVFASGFGRAFESDATVKSKAEIFTPDASIDRGFALSDCVQTWARKSQIHTNKLVAIPLGPEETALIVGAAFVTVVVGDVSLQMDAMVRGKRVSGCAYPQPPYTANYLLCHGLFVSFVF